MKKKMKAEAFLDCIHFLLIHFALTWDFSFSLSVVSFSC